jgi:hypothetical protein
VAGQDGEAIGKLRAGIHFYDSNLGFFHVPFYDSNLTSSDNKNAQLKKAKELEAYLDSMIMTKRGKNGIANQDSVPTTELEDLRCELSRFLTANGEKSSVIQLGAKLHHVIARFILPLTAKTNKSLPPKLHSSLNELLGCVDVFFGLELPSALQIDLRKIELKVGSVAENQEDTLAVIKADQSAIIRSIVNLETSMLEVFVFSLCVLVLATTLNEFKGAQTNMKYKFCSEGYTILFWKSSSGQ